VAAEQKGTATRVEINVLLAFLYWVGIALHPFDITIFVLKRDVKLQLTN